MSLKIMVSIVLSLLLTMPIIAQDETDALPDKTLPGEDQSSSQGASEGDSLEDTIQAMLEQGDEAIELEDLISFVEFDDEDDWEFYEDDDFYAYVEDGVYEVQSDNGSVMWGQNDDEHEDVVIQVDAILTEGDDVSAYGMMCRASEDSFTLDGYHFYVSDEGNASIYVYEDDEFTLLAGFDEQFDDIVNSEELNQIVIVCVDEYLALYVNGELLVETEDDTYDEGYVSLSVVSWEDEEVTVEFDNVYVWEASD